MKFWVRFSRTISKLAAYSLLKKIRPKSIEAVLRNSTSLLDTDTISEIRKFISEKQTSAGGFADRAGKPDIYYSLFGCFVAEALSCGEVLDHLKKYVHDQILNKSLSGVNLYCGAILYAKTHGIDNQSLEFARQIAAELDNPDTKQKEYINFMGFLALYYLEDYFALLRLINRYRQINNSQPLPCPVLAANAILRQLSGQKNKADEVRLLSFLGKNGGFKALVNAQNEDLLSTGVALYALRLSDADLRIIKPDCLAFIDSLYLDGGFRSMLVDPDTDVEYTFYGLLGLGSLSL